MAILKLDNVTIRFGGLVAVDSVNLTVEQGTIQALIGPNGAGKSTMFNLITGIYNPTSGTISFKDRSIAGMPTYRIASAGIGRTFQNIRLFTDLSVLDNVCIAYHPHCGYNIADALLRTPRYESKEKELVERAQGFLSVFSLQDRQNEIAKNLPYGEQRRLEIARALATEPRLLLLASQLRQLIVDEKPTAAAVEELYFAKDSRTAAMTCKSQKCCHFSSGASRMVSLVPAPALLMRISKAISCPSSGQSSRFSK